jgi:hypothetical protein
VIVCLANPACRLALWNTLVTVTAIVVNGVHEAVKDTRTKFAKPDVDRCTEIINAAKAACTEELYGGSSNGHGQAGPSLWRKCVRSKVAGSGCDF